MYFNGEGDHGVTREADFQSYSSTSSKICNYLHSNENSNMEQ